MPALINPLQDAQWAFTSEEEATVAAMALRLARRGKGDGEVCHLAQFGCWSPSSFHAGRLFSQ
jgi:hypothetical protein